MARIVWRDGAVLSVKIRDDLYTLVQMAKSPYLAFFDCFRSEDNWDGVDLDESSVLFVRAVTRQLLRAADFTVHRAVAPATGIEVPSRWLQVGPGSQALSVWPGTAAEMTVMTLGEEGVRVIEKVVTDDGHTRNVLGPYLTGPEHPELDLYELDTLGVYPETPERLYLCHVFGRNVDPDKDLICGRDVPMEFGIYYEAISQ